VSRAQGLLEALELSFKDALRAAEGTAEAVALLWTDAESHWLPLLPHLQAAMPQVFTLGAYNPKERSGPAIWLRCVVDRALPEVCLAERVVPILYLPGVTRFQLRAGAECPAMLQPLIELQYRGRVWYQKNGNDWSVEAFLVSEDGLGLDLARDARTKEALARALPLLAETPLDGLRGHRLEAEDFDKLSVSDPTRDLLNWMIGEVAFRKGMHDDRWRSFCGVCRSEFKFDPDKRTPADAAAALIEGGGKWDGVWHRFREAPRLHAGLAQLLREVPGQMKLGGDPERTPRANDAGEALLRRELAAVAALPHAQAIERVLVLEADHGPRRSWVWSELGQSVLAGALEPLARLASAARTTLGGATVAAAATAYADGGWGSDRAALEALVSVTSQADLQIVQPVVKALYGPWLDASARHFQTLFSAAEGAVRGQVSGTSSEKDACVLFADGLRFDIATILKDRCEAKGLQVRLSHRLAPLPTVTATAKPFATVVSDCLEGGEDVIDFNPRIRDSAQAANAQRLRDQMLEVGVDVLLDEVRPPKAGATGGWVETGRLDELGHKLGAQLAVHLDAEVDALRDRIEGLLAAGWRRVRVVTDHGWLLLPGGLPRVDLPTFLAATKWARCATVKGNSQTSMPTYLWHWNTHVRIASPPGIACFSAGNEYAHGGVSPQECVVPDMVVERGDAGVTACITGVVWRGMRCRVSVTTSDPKVRADLRLNWKQPSTSIAGSIKEVGPAGEASLVVTDDNHEGTAATVVLIDEGGNVLDRKPTTVGDAS
jgi:hypothetical protein